MSNSGDKCSCNGACGDACSCSQKTLADLMIGEKAVIASFAKVKTQWQKFYNIGIIAGSEVIVEAFAPFGGLIRIKVMNSSIVLHKSDAANILVK